MNNDILTQKLTPVFDADRPELEEHTISAAYRVEDQYGRTMGWLLRANYADEKRQSWFAVGKDGAVSVHLYLKRSEAADCLTTMYRAYLLTMTMSKAILPGSRPKIEMLTLSKEA